MLFLLCLVISMRLLTGRVLEGKVEGVERQAESLPGRILMTKQLSLVPFRVVLSTTVERDTGHLCYYM